MKSIRLSESKRADILKSIMDAWDANHPEPDVKGTMDKVSAYYYEAGIGSDILKLVRNKKLQPYLKTGRTFLVQIAGIMEEFNLPEKLPLPKEDNGYCRPCILVIDGPSALHVELKKLQRAHDEWEKERRTMQQEAREIIAVAASTVQLLEVWPELEPLLPAYLVDPSQGVRLPSIPVSRLNERLGLNSGGNNENNNTR